MTDRPETMPPDPEVPAKPKRRTYPAEYKKRILESLDACTKSGERAALLRREGLYDSTIRDWQQARLNGTLAGAKIGRPAKSPEQVENEKLRRENDKLREQLRKASLIIDVQKKISLLLDIKQPSEEEILRDHKK